MATKENITERNHKIKEEYKTLRKDLIISRDEAEQILAIKYNRKAGTIREINSRKDYPTKTLSH